MDNLTHTLVGVALARTGLNRWCPHATVLLVLAANAPDVDIVSLAGGQLGYLEHHRAHTHAFPLSPLTALLPMAVVGLIRRRRDFPWRNAFLLSLIGVLSHILLDWTNIYGVRLLLPLSPRWSELGTSHVVDLWIWLFLLLSVAAPALSRLVSTEIGAKPGTGRGWAILALSFVLLYNVGRAAPRARALEALQSQVVDGRIPRRVAAFPDPVNPFRWRGLVETDDFFALHDVRLWEPFDPTSGLIFYKPDPSPAIEAAARTRTFRVFLDFARYPLWRVTPAPETEGGYLVEAADLRFGTPPDARFVALARLDAAYRVVDARFQFALPGSRVVAPFPSPRAAHRAVID